MPSNHFILCHPLLLLPPIFPSNRVFPMSQLFTTGCQSIGASASASAFPMNIQGWFPLGLTGLISLLPKVLSRVLQYHHLKAFWVFYYFSQTQSYLVQNCHQQVSSYWAQDKTGFFNKLTSLYLFSLAVLWSMKNISSQNRDWTDAPCIGNMES